MERGILGHLAKHCGTVHFLNGWGDPLHVKRDWFLGDLPRGPFFNSNTTYNNSSPTFVSNQSNTPTSGYLYYSVAYPYGSLVLSGDVLSHSYYTYYVSYGTYVWHFSYSYGEILEFYNTSSIVSLLSLSMALCSLI